MKTSPIIALDFHSAEEAFAFLTMLLTETQCQSRHATLL